MSGGPAAAVAGRLVRPIIAGTLRTRRARSRQARVTAVQWAGFVAVALASTWLRELAEDAVERHLGRRPPTR